ncbi:fibronectin type III domain-containing protein [Plantactinospora endophytica]|uniref:Fibronectin type-III domain-containing protein n=1 Tax=Plantactinospora endophytica TaxID=673535 RepID=A0ABQ4E8A2_9ACTN|nr:fibronectin type III domain-containing protein [Plantactinospora endophytica]GIG90905.1 hypothetical protein Pen02_58410 [Plantactinospora endophytica]
MSTPVSTVAAPGRRWYTPIAAGLALVTTATLASALPATVARAVPHGTAPARPAAADAHLPETAADSRLHATAADGQPPAAAAAPLFTDDFEDGNAAGWSTAGGQWSVGTDTTRAYRQRSGSAAASARAGDSTWTDYTVSAQVRPNALSSARSSIGLLARVQSSTSHYYLNLRGNGQLELGKLVAGRVTVLASAPATAAIGGWQTLRLALLGNQLVGQLGTVSVSATDSQFGQGRIGLATGYATGWFDDVLVEPPAPDIQPPSPPGQPQVLSVVPGAVTITWPASTDNVGVTQYWVYQGDQFYSQYVARIVPDNSPLTLQLNPTAARSHFSVTARDAVGNTSSFSARTSVDQPPSFPRSGDDTVRPSAPGAPVVTAVTPNGYQVTWEPATDDIGVVEYHVYHVFALDEIRVDAKVTTNSAVIVPRGGYETIYVVAYDASWNRSSSPTVQLVPPATPPARR